MDAFIFFLSVGKEKRKTSDVSPASLLLEASGKAVAELGRESVAVRPRAGSAARALLGGVVPLSLLQTLWRDISALPEHLC